MADRAAIASMLGVPDSDLPKVLGPADGIMHQDEDDPFDDSDYEKYSAQQFA